MNARIENERLNSTADGIYFKNLVKNSKDQHEYPSNHEPKNLPDAHNQNFKNNIEQNIAHPAAECPKAFIKLKKRIAKYRA